MADWEEVGVEAEEDEILTAVDVRTALDAACPLPILDVVVHDDVAGAGCAAGVLGSPWWNVEVP